MDDVVTRSAQTGPLGGGEVREYDAVTRVQDPQPERLFLVEPTGVQHDHSGGSSLPTADIDLVLDVMAGPPSRPELLPAEDERLTLCDLGYQLQAPPSIRQRSGGS